MSIMEDSIWRIGTVDEESGNLAGVVRSIDVNTASYFSDIMRKYLEVALPVELVCVVVFFDIFGKKSNHTRVWQLRFHHCHDLVSFGKMLQIKGVHCRNTLPEGIGKGVVIIMRSHIGNDKPADEIWKSQRKNHCCLAPH